MLQTWTSSKVVQAVLSSGAMNSKTDSVPVHFQFLVVEFCSGAIGSFEPVAVALRSMLETVHGPFALAFWSLKCQACLGPERPETIFTHRCTAFLAGLSPTSCFFCMFESSLSQTHQTLHRSSEGDFCYVWTWLKVIYLCFGFATWPSRLRLP